MTASTPATGGPSAGAGLTARLRVDARDVDVALTVPRGGVLAIIGPNGAGKSTVIDAVAGLLRPDAAHITVAGTVLDDTARRVHLPAHRRGVGLLAQHALLFPHLTVLDNVAFGPRSAGAGRRASRDRARSALDTVGASGLADRRPRSLSGGQQQRVALARVLATDPRVVLLDEPMAALDVTVAAATRSVLRRVLARTRPTALLVTHDVLDVLALADGVVVIDGGRVVESGSVDDVISRPRSAFAARVAGLVLVPGRATGAGVDSADGLVHGVVDDDCPPGSDAVAVFAPTAVTVHRDRPHGSARTVVPVRIDELEPRGQAIRVHAGSWAADVTPSAVAELALEPGSDVWFAVKATEVRIHAVRMHAVGADEVRDPSERSAAAADPHRDECDQVDDGADREDQR